MKALPETVSPYRRTATFDTGSVPQGLLRSHATKPGTWGKIVVEHGELTYRILAPELEEVLLSPGTHGVVEPEVPHEVVLHPGAAFHVEFYR